MKLVGRKKLVAFQRHHPEVRAWVASWVREVEAACWKRPLDVKRRYVSASVISGNVIIFDVRGNRFRLEVQVSFESQVVAVSRWGTHADYDKWK